MNRYRREQEEQVRNQAVEIRANVGELGGPVRLVKVENGR